MWAIIAPASPLRLRHATSCTSSCRSLPFPLSPAPPPHLCGSAMPPATRPPAAPCPSRCRLHPLLTFAVAPCHQLHVLLPLPALPAVACTPPSPLRLRHATSYTSSCRSLPFPLSPAPPPHLWGSAMPPATRPPAAPCPSRCRLHPRLTFAVPPCHQLHVLLPLLALPAVACTPASPLRLRHATSYTSSCRSLPFPLSPAPPPHLCGCAMPPAASPPAAPCPLCTWIRAACGRGRWCGSAPSSRPRAAAGPCPPSPSEESSSPAPRPCNFIFIVKIIWFHSLFRANQIVVERETFSWNWNLRTSSHILQIQNENQGIMFNLRMSIITITQVLDFNINSCQTTIFLWRNLK